PLAIPAPPSAPPRRSPALNGDKGDHITVQVTPSDGEQSGTPATSASVTIADTAPVIDSVSIDQSSPKTNDMLTVSVTSRDEDGDSVSYSYQRPNTDVSLIP